MKAIFEVPDVEHQGDIDHFTGIIQDAGGEILKVNWNGEEDDTAYIVYQCRDKNHQKIILDKLENVYIMGHRLHVAKKYVVEYTTSASFSYEVEAFHDLLSSLDVSYTGESWDDQFEVTREDWKKGIAKLKNLPNLETEEKEDIESALKDLREPLPEIIRFMEVLLKEADPEHEFMVLSFF